MNRLAIVIATLIVALSPSAARAENAEPILLVDEAEAFHADGLSRRETDPAAARGDFLAAVERLERLRRQFGTSAAIEYNLGNARIQAGDLGRGIAAYLRAERLAPADPRIAANLAHARGLVSRPVNGDAVRPAWAAAGNWWTAIGPRFPVFAASWSLAWIIVAALVLGRDRSAAWRKPARTVAIVLAAIGLASGITLALDLADRHLRPLGVTVADGVVVRKGNGEGFAPQIAERLVPGVEFRLLERRPGWIRVRLPDATEGWIREEQAEEA